MFTFLVLSIAAVASASLTSLGTCPSTEPMPNFDVERFEGVWREQQKFFKAVEPAGECGKILYIYNECKPNTYNVTFMNIYNCVQYSFSGTAAIVSGTGKLVLEIEVQGQIVTQVVNIICTDYTSYAVLYNCVPNSENPTCRDEDLWIYSKTSEPTLAGTVAVNLCLDTHGIDKSRLIDTNHSPQACTCTQSL